jgi:RNA polymerase sigma factor (sigma-70 family)
VNAGPDPRAAEDCALYIREHHAELFRIAIAQMRLHRLEHHLGDEMLAGLFEVLVRNWGSRLLLADDAERIGFAFTTLRNLAKRHKSDTAARRCVPLAEEHDINDDYYIPEQCEPLEDTVIRSIFAGSCREPIRKILAEDLTDEERDVITMLYPLEKQQSQIAAELGIHPKQVSRRRQSALAKLRAGLPAQLRDDVPSNTPGGAK